MLHARDEGPLNKKKIPWYEASHALAVRSHMRNLNTRKYEPAGALVLDSSRRRSVTCGIIRESGLEKGPQAQSPKHVSSVHRNDRQGFRGKSAEVRASCRHGSCYCRIFSSVCAMRASVKYVARSMSKLVALAARSISCSITSSSSCFDCMYVFRSHVKRV